MFKSVSIYFFFALIVASSNSFGQAWLQSRGPAGGDVLDLEERDGSIVATTYGGIYRSVDNGDTWNHANTGLLMNEQPEYLTKTTNFIFAAGFSIGHLYKSADNGLSWNNVPINLGSLIILEIYGSHDTLYLGLYGGGVVRSVNEGASFEYINAGFPGSAYVGCFAQVGQYLFAGLSGNGGTVGIYRTPVNAINWTQMNNGLTAPLTFPSVIDIQAKGSDLFIVAGSAFASGIFRSVDFGDTWFEPQPGFNDFGGSLAVYHGDLYTAGDGVGVFKSTNDGASWSFANTGLKALSAFCYLPGSNALFMGTERGVARTTNEAVSWDIKSRGLTNTWVTSFYAEADTLFATTRSNTPGRSEGFYFTTDGGQNWPLMNKGLSPDPEINAVLKSAGNIILGSDGNGIYLKKPTDTSFIQLTDVPDIALVGALISSSNIVLAGVIGLGELYRSTDNGLTWVQSNTGFNTAQEDQVLSFHELNGVIYAGAFNALYKSTDYGLTWTNSNSGIYPGAVITGITSIGNVLYAADHQTGIYKSMNNGATWLPANNGISAGINAIIAYNGILYAGSDAGVFRSTDNGDSWTEYNDGLLPERFISSLAVFNNQLVLGTKETAAWFNISIVPLQLVNFNAVAVNNEYINLTWTTAHENDVKQYAIERAINGSNNFIDIGTISPLNNQQEQSYAFSDHNIMANVDYQYRLRVKDMSGEKYSEIRTAKITAGNSAMHLSPNPAFGNEVNVSIKGYKGEVEINIVSIAGQRVYHKAILLQENAVIPVNIQNLPKGIYFVQLKMQSQVITKKLVIN